MLRICFFGTILARCSRCIIDLYARVSCGSLRLLSGSTKIALLSILSITMFTFMYWISMLAGTADDFPPSLWDRLLPQAEITVHLLRQSNATPTVSAYAHLTGPFDYNKMPLAPMGCAVQVHEKTNKRGTWAYQSVDGWYLATSPEHYHTHRCHIKETHSERLTDTAHSSHKRLTNPTITHADKIMAAIAECDKIIKDKGSPNGQPQLEELRQLADAVRKDPALASDFTKKTTPNVAHQLEELRAQGALRDSNHMQTRSKDSAMQPAPRVPSQASPRVEKPAAIHEAAPALSKKAKQRRRRRAAVRMAANSKAPSSNTRARTKQAAA